MKLESEPSGEALPASVLEREVGATPQEFLRGLHSAFPGRVEEIGGNAIGQVRINHGHAVMELEFTPLTERRIAQLRLPNMRVGIRFTAGSREEQEAMLAWMDLVTHRGGG